MAAAAIVALLGLRTGVQAAPSEAGTDPAVEASA
jgi:hypothetical protein